MVVKGINLGLSKKELTELASKLKKENNELKLQLEAASFNNQLYTKSLDASNLLNEMYKSILIEGKFEVKNEDELYRSLYAIGYFAVILEGEEKKRFAQCVNLFDKQEERGQKVYFTYDIIQDVWYINYKNTNGKSIQLTLIQLFNLKQSNLLLDVLDDLK